MEEVRLLGRGTGKRKSMKVNEKVNYICERIIIISISKD